MEQQFDFGRGDYTQIQSFDELVPGEKYLIRVRNPIRNEFISTYLGSNEIFLNFDVGLYMRSGRDHTPWAPPIAPYDGRLFRDFSRGHVTFDNGQVNDNKIQIFSLGMDGNYITPDSPPEMLVQRLQETLHETNKVAFRKELPPEISANIRSFLGGKRRKSLRTQKSKKSRRRKNRKSKKIRKTRKSGKRFK
jgi:hypothetical protein